MSKGFFKTYLRLALPAIIAQLVVFVVDNLNVAILGSLSEKAISGYTIANQSYDIYVMLALGLSGGSMSIFPSCMEALTGKSVLRYCS